MDPKKRRKHKARSGGLCQQRMITNDVRQVVTSITAITANPANNSKSGVNILSYTVIIQK